MSVKVSRRRALARLGVRVARVVERVPDKYWECKRGFTYNVFQECARKRGVQFANSEFHEEARATLELFRR